MHRHADDTLTDDGTLTDDRTLTDEGGTSAPARTGRQQSTVAAGRAPLSARKRFSLEWARRIHVYTSMVALLVVLFFGATGLTLNHPDWTFGDDVSTDTYAGAFPFAVQDDGGAIDYLAAAEFVRTTYDVRGSVDSYDVADGTASIAFKNPGYSADLFFDVADGSYDLTVTRQGWVAVMNDLHKGRDSGSAWRWVIDVSAGFLVAISLTGLLMQLFLRRRRRAALVTAGLGAALTVVLIVVTLL